MTRRVVLHIGVHKTGSSAIQGFLHRNAAALRDQSIFYQPSVAGWDDNNALADAFDRCRDPALGISHLRDLMEQVPNGTLLLSSEMLIEAQVDSRRLLDVLDGWDKTAIAYLRHPCDILIAAFGECVKHYPLHYTRRINELPLAYDPGQHDMLAAWMQYGDVRLNLAPYDPPQWVGGSLLADFLSMIGGSSRGLDFEDVRTNVSLSFASSERLRQAMAMGATAADHQALREWLSLHDEDDGGYPLDRATILYCFERMRECLEPLRPHMRAGFDVSYLFDARWPG